MRNHGFFFGLNGPAETLTGECLTVGEYLFGEYFAKRGAFVRFGLKLPLDISILFMTS